MLFFFLLLNMPISNIEEMASAEDALRNSSTRNIRRTLGGSHVARHQTKKILYLDNNAKQVLILHYQRALLIENA